MNTAVLFITLFACMAIGMPVAISLGFAVRQGAEFAFGGRSR